MRHLLLIALFTASLFAVGCRATVHTHRPKAVKVHVHKKHHVHVHHAHYRH